MEANDIVIIKLINGEVVMGRVKEEDAENIVLTHPMTLMLDPTQGGVGMLPYDAIYTQLEPEEQVFDKAHLMHELPVHATFEEAYIKQTTGIDTTTPTIEV